MNPLSQPFQGGVSYVKIPVKLAQHQKSAFVSQFQGLILKLAGTQRVRHTGNDIIRFQQEGFFYR